MKRLITFLALCCLMVTGVWAEGYAPFPNVSGWTKETMQNWIPTSIPQGIADIQSPAYYAADYGGTQGLVKFDTSATATATFEYSDGNCGAWIIGVELLDPFTEEVLISCYNKQFTGGDKLQVSYELANVEANKVYLMRIYYSPEGDDVANPQHPYRDIANGTITWTGSTPAPCSHYAITVSGLADGITGGGVVYDGQTYTTSLTVSPSVDTSQLTPSYVAGYVPVMTISGNTITVAYTALPFQEGKYYTMHSKASQNNYVFNGTNAWYDNSVTVDNHNNLWQFEHVTGTPDLYMLKTYSGKYAVLSGSGRNALIFADEPTVWTTGTGATSYFRVVAQNGGFDLQHPGDVETNVGSHVDNMVGSWKNANSPTNDASINVVTEAALVDGQYIRLLNRKYGTYMSANGNTVNGNTDGTGVSSLWYVTNDTKLMNVGTGNFLGGISNSKNVTLNATNTTTYEFEVVSDYVAFKQTGGGDYQYGHINGSNVLVGWEKSADATQWTLSKPEVTPIEYTITVSGLAEGVTGGGIVYGGQTYGNEGKFTSASGLDGTLLTPVLVDYYDVSSISVDGANITVTYAKVKLPFEVGKTYRVTLNGANNYVSYVADDATGKFKMSSSVSQDDAKGYFTIGGNEADGFTLYSVGAGAYVQQGSGNNAKATATNEEASAARYDVTINNGNCFFKIHGSENAYVNSRDDYFSTWTHTDIFGTDGSKLTFTLAPVEEAYTLSPADGETIESLTNFTLTFTSANAESISWNQQTRPTLTKEGSDPIQGSVMMMDFGLAGIAFEGVTDGTWTLNVPSGTFIIQGEGDAADTPVKGFTATYMVDAPDEIATFDYGWLPGTTDADPQWKEWTGEVPAGISTQNEYCTADNLFVITKSYEFTNDLNKLQVTFQHEGGNQRTEIVGVDVTAANGTVYSDYHHGYTGTSMAGNVYTITDIPAGTYTVRYITTKHWGSEQNTQIKGHITPVVTKPTPQITDLANLSNDKAYVLICERGQLSSSNGQLVPVAKDREDAYTAEANMFAIIKSNDKYYLWSVAEDGYVRTDMAIHTLLAAQPITLTAQQDGTFLLVLNGNGVNMQENLNNGIIIDNFTTPDAGNKYAIYEVGDFADAETAIAAIPGTWKLEDGHIYTIKAHFNGESQNALYLTKDSNATLQFAETATPAQSYWIARATGDNARPWKFQAAYGDGSYLDANNAENALSTTGLNMEVGPIDKNYCYMRASLTGVGERYIGTYCTTDEKYPGFGLYGSTCYGGSHYHSGWTTYYEIAEVTDGTCVYDVVCNNENGGVVVSNITDFNGATEVPVGGVVVTEQTITAENLAPKTIEGFTGNVILDTEAHIISIQYGKNYTVAISGTHASEAKVLYNGAEYANGTSFSNIGIPSVEEIAATYYDGEYAKITIDETNATVNVEYRSTENAGIYNIGASTQNILPGKWYIMTQTRGGETPVYNNGVNSDIMRAGQNASTVLAPATKFTGVADKYLIRFTEGDYEGTYKITFADGGLWNENQVKADAGNYFIKPAVNTSDNRKPGLAINMTTDGTTYGSKLDNNGKGDRVVKYESGAYTEGGNNVWYIYPVELDDVATVTYLVTNPYGEEVAFTESAFAGTSPVAPQIYWYEDSEISDAKTIEAGENTFHVTGTWALPFEEGKSYTMHTGDNNNNFVYGIGDQDANNPAAYINNSVKATSGSDIWEFEHVEGTLDLYTVKNAKAGYVTVANANNQTLPTYEETPTAWDGGTDATSYFRIVPNGNGFDLQHPGKANANVGNHVNDRLGIWDADGSATHARSRILVTEVTEATYTLAFGVNAPADAKITYAGQDYTDGDEITLMGVFHPAEVVSSPDTYRTTITVDELSKTVGIDFILKKDYTVTITGVPEGQTATLTYAGTAYNTNDVIHADATLSVNELTATVISSYSPKVEIGEGTITVTYRERKYTVVVTNADQYGDEGTPALKKATICIGTSEPYGNGAVTETYAEPLSAEGIVITSGPELDWMDKSVRVDESNLTINVYQKLYHPLWRLEELPTDGTPVMVFDASIERDRSWKGFHYAEGTTMQKTEDIYPLLYAGTLASVWTLEAGPDENSYYLRNEATGNYHNYSGTGYASREESGYLYIIDFPSSTVTKQTDEAHVDNFYGEQIGLAKDDIGQWTVGKTKTGNEGNSNWNGQEEYFVSHTHSSAFAFYSLKELTPTLANDSIKAVCLNYAEYFDGANGKGHDYGTFGTRYNDAEHLTNESTFTEYCNIIRESTARTIKAPAPGRLLTIVNAFSAEYMDGTALTKDRAVTWFNSQGQLISWNTGLGLSGASVAATPDKDAESNGDVLYQPDIDPNTGTFVVDDDKANSGVMGTMVIRTTGDDGIYYSENNTHKLIAATEKNNTSATWFVDNADYVDLNIPASGYTTLYAPVPMQVAEGVTAYTIVTDEGKDESDLHICTLTLTPLADGIIPAGTAVVLAGESGATRVNVIYAEDEDGKVDESAYANITFSGTNALKGYDYTCKNPQTSASNGVDGKYIYTLSSGKFQYYTGSTIKAFKCFLELTQDYRAGHNREGVATNPFRVIINEGPTGISSTRTSSDSNAYDLSGRRINVQSERGLYILNGKKVIR